MTLYVLRSVLSIDRHAMPALIIEGSCNMFFNYYSYEKLVILSNIIP